jgi:hypothetical protein
MKLFGRRVRKAERRRWKRVGMIEVRPGQWMPRSAFTDRQLAVMARGEKLSRRERDTGLRRFER